MSLCDERPKAGTTTRIIAVFVGVDGSLLTGLTPTIRIKCQSGDNAGYLNTGTPDTWEATPAADPEMLETSDNYMPGYYYYDFAIPAGQYVGYDIRCDGGPTAVNRYQDYRIEAIAYDEADSSSPAGAITLGGGIDAMDFKVLAAITCDGTDQAQEVANSYALALTAEGGDVQIRNVAGSTEYFPLKSGQTCKLGPSIRAQTIYVRGEVGTTVRLALT